MRSRMAALALAGLLGCGRGSARSQQASGWVRESNGTVHRATVVACTATHHKPPCRPDASEHTCGADADCKAGPHPKCVHGYLYSEPRYNGSCYCAYSCSTDEECGAGKACVCDNSTRGTCAEARCRTDSDCVWGVCALSRIERADDDELTLACRGPVDACQRDSDCKGVERCVYLRREGRWGCDAGRDMF